MPARRIQGPTAGGLITTILYRERETKGTWRYKEDVADDAKPIIGTVYLPKETLNSMDNPDSIEITIKPHTT